MTEFSTQEYKDKCVKLRQMIADIEKMPYDVNYKAAAIKSLSCFLKENAKLSVMGSKSEIIECKNCGNYTPEPRYISSLDEYRNDAGGICSELKRYMPEGCICKLTNPICSRIYGKISDDESWDIDRKITMEIFKIIEKL